MNKLRSKSTIYKKKRQVLQDLKAESGVVSRTVEILKSRDDNINKQLEALESKKGVAGYRDTQDELEKVGISRFGEGDKQHRISCGDNFHKLCLLTLIDRILKVL